MEGISTHLQRQSGAVEVTKDNERITPNVAFNYGGRAEILTASAG
ncbi:MAG: hypothetical protein R2838_08285 [Caldilineaceae bacterium]